MCANCGGRKLTPARAALAEAERVIRQQAREARLRALPAYHREITISEKGVQAAGIMRLSSRPGVNIVQWHNDGVQWYKITLASADDYAAVKALIESERPAAARAEAAREHGVRPGMRVRFDARRGA